MIGRGNLLTSISFPSQDSGTLTAVMAVLCEWNGPLTSRFPLVPESGAAVLSMSWPWLVDDLRHRVAGHATGLDPPAEPLPPPDRAL